MQYATGQMMKVGDEVVVDGMKGVIVCDFDNREFKTGYESWNMPTTEMLGGGTLSFGVMIETIEAGMVHYIDGSSGSIECISSRSR